MLGAGEPAAAAAPFARSAAGCARALMFSVGHAVASRAWRSRAALRAASRLAMQDLPQHPMHSLETPNAHAQFASARSRASAQADWSTLLCGAHKYTFVEENQFVGEHSAPSARWAGAYWRQPLNNSACGYSSCPRKSCWHGWRGNARGGAVLTSGSSLMALRRWPAGSRAPAVTPPRLSEGLPCRCRHRVMEGAGRGQRGQPRLPGCDRLLDVRDRVDGSSRRCAVCDRAARLPAAAHGVHTA